MNVRQELHADAAAGNLAAFNDRALLNAVPGDVQHRFLNGLMDDIECRIWRKWDELKERHFVLRLAAGLVEGKVLRPILGERPATCP